VAFLSSKRFLVDLGIAGAVVIFFIAGVFFQSRRSDGGDEADIDALNAAATSTAASAVASSTPGSSSGDQQATGGPAQPGELNPDAVGQPVFIQFEGIENESVVEAASVLINGFTTPDALLSVNGEATPVELDGSFTADVALEAGPNFIEFVASNLQGQQTSRVLSIVSVQ
jgi:hypothetical protein